MWPDLMRRFLLLCTLSSFLGSPQIQATEFVRTLELAPAQLDSRTVLDANASAPAAYVPASYYLSPTGNDTTNTGLSSGSPWQSLAKLNAATLQPGDQVFLQGGATFTGPLVVSASGTAGNPIVFNSYGTGKATIQITSASSGAISVYNQEHLAFRNLRLVGTAMATSTKPGFEIYADIDRVGLVIDGLEVTGFKGGIEVGAWAGSAGYDNVLIQNCEVHDNRRGGIFTYGEQIDAHSNVTIRDSISYNNRGEVGATGNTGNGILMSGVTGGLIERCLVRDCGDLGFGSVGIWTYQATNVVIQYCEVYNQKAASTSDGGGFDFDGATTNSIIQYCYSHNNDGAGYLFAQYQGASAYGPLSGNIIRYSISKNDGRRRNYGALMFWGHNSTDRVGANEVYNNIFYVGGTPTDGTPSALRFLGSNFTGLKIRNNVFIAADGSKILNADGVTSTSQALFQGNSWWSVSGNSFVIQQGGTIYNSLAAWKAAVSGQEMNGATSLGLSADPRLLSPASAGALATTLADTPNLETMIKALGGFRAQIDSPLINAGLDLTSATYGSLNVGTQDIAGTALPQGAAYDIGAYDQAAFTAAPSGLTAASASSSQINLTWTDNSATETGFKLERSLNGTTSWTQIATPAANATSTSDTGLNGSTTYFYRLRATNAAGDSSYTVTASATTQTGVQAFRSTYGLAANGSQDLVTPAGDGVANLLKYAFNMLGSGPGQASSLTIPNASALTAGGTAGLPLVGVESSTGKLQLTYIRRKSASTPGITYAVEFSNDLGLSDPWAVNGSATETSTSIDATFERVTVTDSVTSPVKRFARGRVTAP